MKVRTCQAFGGPNVQSYDEPSPNRCKNPGEKWATVEATPVDGWPSRGRVVVWACPLHHHWLTDRELVSMAGRNEHGG